MRKYLLLLYILLNGCLSVFAQLSLTVKDTTVCNNVPFEVCAVKPFVTLSNVSFDDRFSRLIDIGFPFKFYGKTYTQLVVSDNNMISFDKRFEDVSSHYIFNDARRSTQLDFSIMFPFQDLNIETGTGKVSYRVEGDAPHRRFIVEFCNVTYFSYFGECKDLQATDQLILNETSNTIEMHIQKKESCTFWPQYLVERAVQGIRGANSSEELYVPGRGLKNLGWTVTVPEAKMFEPDGNSYIIKDIPYHPAKFFYEQGGFTWYKQNSTIPFSSDNCAQITPDTAVKYYVVKYQGPVGCNAQTIDYLTDTVYVHYNPPTAPYTLKVCKQDLPLEWNGVTVPLNAVTKANWDTVLVHQPGKCDTNFIVSLNIIDVPQPTFDDIGTLCADTKFSLPSVSKNGISGKWSPAIDNQKTTTYTFVSDLSPCSTYTMVVNITPKTKPIFDPVAKICEDTPLSPLPTTSKNGVSGTWQPALNNQKTTRYYFTPQAGLCADTTSIVIEVDPKVTPTFDPILPVCKGDTLILPTISKEGITGSWTPNINNKNTTVYTFIPNPNECAVTKTITVKVYPIPQAKLVFNTSQIRMVNEPIVFQNASTIDNNDFTGVVYDWDFGDSTYSNLAQPPAHIYTKSGTYTVKLKVVNAIGCHVSEVTTQVVIHGYPKAQFTINKDKSCVIEPINITNTSTTDNNPIVQMNWYYDFGVNTAQDEVFFNDQSIGTTTAIKYPYTIFTDRMVKILLIVKAATGHTDTAEKIITLIPSPELVFTDTVSSTCQFDAPYQFTVKELRGVEGYGEFTGMGVNTNGVFTPALVDGNSTNIIYTFYPKYGCITSIDKTVAVNKLALIEMPPDITVFETDTFKVSPIYYGEIQSYHWTDTNGVEISTEASPSFSFQSDQLLTLKVSNNDGCITEKTLSVKVFNEVSTSNAFSPNGDGVNDEWLIPNLKKYGSEALVKVYDRNGQIVFKSQGYETPWNGRNHNELLPFGTYFYVITKPYGKRQISGTVTILK